MGHFSNDCPNAPKMTCRNCGEEGHKSAECDKPRDPSTITCRNCDEVGHFSKECPKPRDWSRVKCPICEEMGHGPRRCTKANEPGGGFESGAGFDTNGFGNGDGW